MGKRSKGNDWTEKVPKKLEIGMKFIWGEEKEFRGEIVELNNKGTYGMIRRENILTQEISKIPFQSKSWIKKINSRMVKWDKAIEQLTFDIFD